MRGRKKDPEFLASFIQACAQNNQLTPQDIIRTAQSKIHQLTQELQRIEELKKEIVNLQDVVHHFEGK